MFRPRRCSVTEPPSSPIDEPQRGRPEFGSEPTSRPPRRIGDDPSAEPALNGSITAKGDPVGDEPGVAAGFETSHDRYLASRQATPVSHRWLAFAVVLVAAGPMGLAAALLGSPGAARSVAFAAIGSIVFIPIIEEIAKAAGALYLVENRPWLVPSAATVVALVAMSGLVFALAENWLYLNVYIEDPSEQVIRIRQIGGPLLHTSASLLAGIGVSRVWLTIHHGRIERWAFRPAVPWMVSAMVLHGAYNLSATILEVTGVIG